MSGTVLFLAQVVAISDYGGWGLLKSQAKRSGFFLAIYPAMWSGGASLKSSNGYIY